MHVARNVLIEPKLVPGGGAIEMALSTALNTKAAAIDGVSQWIYKNIGAALEVIPRTLSQNCGAKVVKVLTDIRAKHASDNNANFAWGIDGVKGVPADMKVLGVWEPLAGMCLGIFWELAT
jgi:T-complex protein 1 subunit gamma